MKIFPLSSTSPRPPQPYTPLETPFTCFTQIRLPEGSSFIMNMSRLLTAVRLVTPGPASKSTVPQKLPVVKRFPLSSVAPAPTPVPEAEVLQPFIACAQAKDWAFAGDDSNKAIIVGRIKWLNEALIRNFLEKPKLSR